MAVGVFVRVDHVVFEDGDALWRVHRDVGAEKRGRKNTYGDR